MAYGRLGTARQYVQVGDLTEPLRQMYTSIIYADNVRPDAIHAVYFGLVTPMKKLGTQRGQPHEHGSPYRVT